jgi:hypothetical protein
MARSYADMAAQYNVQGVDAQGKSLASSSLTRSEKTLLLGAIGGTAAAGTVATAMAAPAGSKTEAITGGAAKGGLSTAMTGAALGSMLGPAGTATGAVIGGVAGLLVGGISGGMKAQKDYISGKKAERARKKQMRFDAYESGARQRAAAGRGVEMVERQYAATTAPAELDTTVGSGVSSFDNYKARTYGG